MSGTNVAFLDPHEIYFGRGESGQQFNIKHGLLQPQLFDQFAPFHGIFGCDLSSTRSYDNTLFRFPLRTTPESDLSKTVYNESMINNLFESLRQEASIILLFLKSVQSISIFKRTNEGCLDCTFKVEVSNDTRNQVIMEREKSLSAAVETASVVESKFIIGINITSNKKMDSKKWLVVNRIGSNNKRITQLRTQLCLLPWIGLAVPINEGCTPITDGRIFCFLPLPPDVDCITGLPVHIHGYFGLTDNRRGLTWPGMECQNNETAEWNTLLLSEIASTVYCKIIDVLVTDQPNTGLSEVNRSHLVYSTMPALQNVQGHWKCILKPMLQQMSNQPVFYALRITGNSWITLRNGVLDLLHQSGTSSETRDVILKVLYQRYAVITDLPPHVLEIINSFSARKVISPAIVRSVLKESQISVTIRSREQKLNLLTYVLSDGNTTDLVGIPLLPLANTNFITFCKHKHSSNPKASVFVSSGNCTAKLLPNMSSRFLDESIQEDVKRKLYGIATTKNNAKHSTQLVRLTSQIVIQNIRASLPPKWFKGNRDKVSWQPGTSNQPPQSWLEATWTWINASFPTSLAHFEGIPLLPIGNRLGILSKNSMFIFGSEGTYTNLPAQVRDLLSACGCTVLTGLPSYICSHKDINTYVAPPSPSGVLCVLSGISMTVVVPQAAKILTSENRTVFHEFFSSLPNPISSSQRDLLLQLPLFETLHGTATAAQQLKAVSANLNLPQNFMLSRDRVIILSTDSYVQKLLVLLNIQFLSSADMLMQYVFPDISANRYNNQQITILMQWILERITILQSQSQRFVNEMKNLPFVSTQSGTRKVPTELYDPNDDVLHDILNGEKDVFPTGIYATPDLITKLKYLGLKTKETLTASDLLRFAKIIASSAQSSPVITKKVNALLTILNDNPTYLNHCSSNSTLKEDLLRLKWIPCATKPPPNYPNFVQWFNTPALLLPSEVRSLSKALLIGSSMPTFSIYINSELQQVFGFMRDPLLPDVIKQLQTAIASWKAQKNSPGIEVAKFQEMLVQIYCYLSTFQPRDISSAVARASLTDWIWHGNGFCPPKNVALTTDFAIDLRPQLFLLAKEFCSNQTLIKFFLQHSVCRKFSDEDILGVLDSIRKKHAHTTQHTSTEVTQDLTICRAILQWVVKDGRVLPEHLQEKVFVPVQSESNVLILAACKKCTYCDREWLRKGGSEFDIPGNYQVIHDSVSTKVARLLGVPALSTCLLSAETLGFAFEQTGPYESITNRIKTVLREYTEGGIFKELIQNADDARASVVRFLVDWRNGPTEKLLSPDMAASQGPALWAYNNEEFSEHDFQNINKLAGATKVDEVGKIGRFGLGFNAVYHLTDVPSFVSRKYFVLFDPNVNHIENHIQDKSRPGIRIDLASNPRPLSAFEDQFQPYHGVFGCSTQNTGATNFNFDGTLFRFPFRTSDEAKKSDICQSVYNKEKVKQIISSFKECSSLLLLFTQHVTQVELYEIENVSDPSDMRLLLSVSKQSPKIKRSSDPSSSEHPFIEECSSWWRRMLAASITQLVTPSRCELFEIITKETQSNLMCNQFKSETRETWLVASCGGKDTSVSLASGEGRSRGLLPCGGAAARLNSVSSNGSTLKSCVKVDAVNGEAFCFLPLSISTGLPIHVNGYFAVTSNRRGIWERTTSHQHQEIEVRWNESLLKDALCSAYLQLLNDLKTLQTQDYAFCALWPVYGKLQSATWGGLVESVYKSIVSNALPLFYSDGKWLSINEGYILDDELRNVPEVRDALKRLNKHVFDIPPQILSSMIKAGQKKAVLRNTLDLKTFLQKFFLPNIHTIPSNVRDRIICYILDCILSGRIEFAKLMNDYPCVTCSQDGNYLTKPSRLINPKGPAACLFSPEDHRFPVGDCFLKNNRIYALEQLGMVSERISWSEICDRARSVKIVAATSGYKALERTRNLIKYLKENIEKLSKPDPSSISDLRSIEFLPFIPTRPDGYELQWEGSRLKKQLFAPNDVFLSSEKNLVGSSCVIVDDSEETGCGKLGHQVKDLLGFFNRHPTVQQVIRQLDAAISVDNVSSGKRKSLEAVCKRVYKFFDNLITKAYHLGHESQRMSVHNQNQGKSEGEQLLKELSQRSWLFIHGNFIPTRKVAYYWRSGNGAPYLYSLPFEYLENYSRLFNMAGVKQTFSHVDFIDALKSLKETKTDRPLNNDEIKLTLCFATALKDAEIEASQLGQIPLPDCNNVLCMSGELTINLKFWLKDRGDARYVHRDIPPQLALDLGAKSLQNRRLKKYSSTIGIPFGQHEKLTDKLKNILKSYPCDSGILKELVQNADDAGATEIHFIYDTRKLPHEKVIQNHAEEVQGPALCVYNNKPFTPEDLEGIQKLGIGSKTDDPEKTGQYGIGFNAVYHLTDCPSFMSNEDTLCFLDPHCRYAPEATTDSPGEQFQPINEEFKEDFKDVFLGYLGEYFNLKGATMFRLPLRTMERSRESLISSIFVGNYKMNELLSKFKDESKKMLLFLNHVRKISLSEVDKDGQLKEACSVVADLSKESDEKCRELSRIVKRSKHLPTRDVAWHNVTYPLTISNSDKAIETWLVHQCCGSSSQVSKDSIPDGHQFGLFPRGGIAALVSPQRSGSEYKPQHVAYCFLPLPVYTGLPVHVNGHFALDSSRRNLWNDTDQSSPLTKWNNFMKMSVLAPGYATLIYEARKYIPFSQGMVKDSCKCSFANNVDVLRGLSWYHQLFPTPSKDSPWNILAREVYRYLSANNLEVLPVVVADDKPVEVNTSLNECSNDVTHQIRSWLSVKDAYFLEGKHQTKLDEARLFKLLLRMHLPLLLYSPTMVYYWFRHAEITCNVLEPMSLINFIRSFSIPTSNCQVGNLPKHLTKTNVRELLDLKVLIDYCKMEEQFPNLLEGLPILLTADRQLRVFDANHPVYRSKFSDLFPENANSFVHPDLVYSLPEIDNLPEKRVMQRFTVQALNQHFPGIFPEYMRGTSEHLPWNFPQSVPLSRKWFQRLWYFLQSYAIPKLNNNTEVSLSVLGVWPIIPTTSDKLVTINNGKTVLDATHRTTDAAQGKRIREILEKLNCPILNTEITVKRSTNPTPGKIPSTLRTSNVTSPTDDSSHVTDPHVAQPHNVRDVLQVLDFMRRTNYFDTSKLTTDDLRTMLCFVQDDLENLTVQDATILKNLPFYMGIDGTHFSLSEYAYYAVIPHGVPTAEIVKLQFHTRCLFLHPASAAVLNPLYKWLSVGVEISLTEFYRKYIIPHFKIFSRKSQISYLTHIKDDVLLSVGSLKRKVFVEFLIGSLCIPGEDGILHYAREFHDPHNEVFQIMLEDNSDHFPPPPFQSPEWLEFLSEIGMKTRVEENQFLEFCEEVAACGSLDPAANVEKSKALVSYLFYNEHLRSEAFLCSLSSIRFIASEKVESNLLSLHKQFQCNTAADQPPFVQFFDAVPWEYHVLTWTSTQLLPSWAQPGKELRRYLGVQEVPSVECIVSHLQNLSCTLAEICRRDEVLPQPALLKKIMESIYKGLNTELGCGENKNISDDCSPECHSIGLRLISTPCVLVEEGKVVVAGDKLSFESQGDCSFIPFLYPVPRRYCAYEHLMKRLGATEKFTSFQFANVLQAIREKCNNTKMNPNLFEKAKAAMGELFRNLLSESQAGNQTTISDLRELFLPSEREILVKSSDLIFKVAPSFRNVLASRANLKILLPLEKCDLRREKEEEYLNALPENLRPKLMDNLFKKVLDPECLKDKCSSCQEDCPCEFIKRYILIIQSPEFQSCIIRLLKHKKKCTELTEDEQDRLSVFGTNKFEIICMRNITVHLVDTETEEPLENSSIQHQCYADENNSSWKLFIKRATTETQPIFLSYCIDRITRWIFDANCRQVIACMLLCKSPSQLPGILDEFNIAEDFSEEELKIGGEVPVVFHYLLQQNPLFIFHEGEIVAYGIETNETDEMAEAIEDGFMIMKFILAKVMSRTDETESDGSYDFTAEYLIDLGNARKKVSVVDLYKFVQNDAAENHITDLIQFTGDPTIMPSSLDDGKREIREALLKAWRLPQKLRRKVILRLYLRWHPDKNPDNVAFAEEMFKFLLSEIKRMEAEESNIDDSCKFSTMFTCWNRRARRERDTYSNFRANSGGSTRSTSDYTYPDLSEARRWLKQAQRDLEAAQLLFSSSSQSFDALVCFLSHQVVEKSLKAALYAKCGLTDDQLHTHDVYSLAYHVCALRGSPAEITDMAIVVGNYYLTTRYPNQQPGSIVPADAFGTEQSERALENASRLHGTVETLISA